jgi:uroporphyrinogen-III decarboxylase
MMAQNRVRSPEYIDLHNAEAELVWKAFNAGQPIRPPVVLGTNMQYFIFNSQLNPDGEVTFESYSTDANVMLEFQLRSAAWRAEYIAPFCDDLIGVPEVFHVHVDLQNYDEPAYFGAPVEFIPFQVPDTRPILVGDRKNLLFDAGLPDPLYGGWYANAHRLHEDMSDYIRRNPHYLDRPIQLQPFGLYTMGPMTIALALRGNELLIDFYEDPEYVRKLLDFIVEATINRIHAHRQFFGLETLSPDLFIADDAIQLISTKMLYEFLLPGYRKLKTGLTTADRIKIHLCGDATRHFVTLRDELGVNDFETGFPVDFGKLRQELGSEVTIHGGPNVMLLRDGTPEMVRTETERILDSGVCKGGRFVLREGNNLAPHTPLINLEAMFETARCFVYQVVRNHVTNY